LAEVAGLPTPIALAERLLGQLRAEQPELDVAEIERLIAAREDAKALDALEGDLGEARFANLIRSAYEGQQECEPPSLARRIAALRTRLHSVYTTSLDRLLSRAFAGNWTEVCEVRGDAAVRGRVILKLCGSLEDHSTWVLTNTQHERSRERNVDLRETLCATFRARTFLFVGFDGHRSALERLLDMVAEAYTGTQSPTHFIAADAQAWDRYMLRELRERGLVVLPNASVEAWMERCALEGRELIDFSAERARHEYFFAREDLFDELDAQLRARASGWMVMTGAPGMGKSASLERWLTRREAAGMLTAFHFIRPGHQNWAEPDAVRANLAAQIEQMFPEQRDADAAPRSRLEQLLVRVSEVLVQREQQLVVLVDGLDKALSLDHENPIPQIFPHELPRAVFVLVGSRPRYPYLNWFAQRTAALHTINLDTRRESNEAAVRAWWAAMGPKMNPPLTAELERLAIEKAGGNLLHAVKLWQLWSGPGVVRSAECVPEGFEGMLEELWERMGTLPNKKRMRDGLALVCAAHESLPLATIEELLGWDEADAEDEFLPGVREMLLEERLHETPAFRPFHEGLRELIERKLPKKTASYDVALAVFAAWPLQGDEFRRRYALRHRVKHQVEGGLLDEAVASCSDVEYLTAKACEVGVMEVERDIRMTIARLPEGRVRQRLRLTTLARVVRACSHWARRVPEALPSLLHNRLLTNAPYLLGELRWPVPPSSTFWRLRHPLQLRGLARVLDGHQGGVTAVAVLPDGRVVSGSWDKSLRVWDLESGTSVATLVGHQNWINAVAVLPDGRIVSGSSDNSLRVWELGSQRSVALVGHQLRVNAVAVLPDGCIVSGSADKTVRVWDLETETSVVLVGHQRPVSAVAVLPDGRVVSGSYDHTLRVWDLASGSSVATLEGHQGLVSAVAVLPNGRVVSGSWDESLKVWDLESGACVATLKGHRHAVYAVVVRSDGRVISGSADFSLRVWDIELGTSVAILEGHQHTVSAVAVLPGGRVVSGSWDNTVRIWDLASATSVPNLAGHRHAVSAVAVLPDGRIATSSWDRTVRLWDPESGLSVAVLESDSNWVRALAVLPDGRIVTGSGDRSLRVWDVESRTCVAVLEGHRHGVSAVTVLPNGRIVSSADDHSVHVWDAAFRSVATFACQKYLVHALATLPDGRLVCGCSDGKVRLWDAESGTTVASFEGHRGPVHAVSVLPGGRVVSGSDDTTLRVWDVESSSCVVTFEGHTRAVHSVAVLADGRIVSASADNSLRAWNLGSATSTATVLGDNAFVSLAAVHERLLVAGDAVGNVWFIEIPR
jgi:WD40 repeat protein